MTTWTLFDYGVGNLHSLRKALERAGAATQITTDPDVIAAADVAVLPGVGAFGHVMESLKHAREGLRQRHADGRPILGICIGQQILHEASAESPNVPGLGILAGQIARLDPAAGKIPHMGWNQVDGRGPLFEGVPPASHFYYVHSFAAPVGPHAIATTTYGHPFAAAERRGNTIGFQFHPEKSSRVGARVLQNTVAALEEQVS